MGDRVGERLDSFADHENLDAGTWIDLQIVYQSWNDLIMGKRVSKRLWTIQLFRIKDFVLTDICTTFILCTFN